MIHLLLSIAGILITILFVIGTHESAHFLMARALGVKVLRFSIGFGKTLWRRVDKQGTEYVIALVPLGGYVRMLDENEGNVPPEQLARAFNRQPFYKKFLIVVAGPLTNIFCAFALYWLIFLIGFVTIKPIIGTVAPHSIARIGGLQTNQEIIRIDNKHTSSWSSVIFRLIAHAGDHDQATITVKNLNSNTIETHTLDLSHWQLSGLSPDPLGSIGVAPYEPTIPLVIHAIEPQSPAAQSTLQLNDQIKLVNNQPIKDWDELITLISAHPGANFTFTVERNSQTVSVPVTIGAQHDLFFHKTGFLGIGPNFKWPPDLLQTVKYGPVTALSYAWQEIYDFTYLNLLIFSKMLTGKLSMQSLGGPITIFQSAGDALNYGFVAFFGFLAFLSISIGVINLLPIPGLDGGHIFLQFVEFVIRRPVPERVLLFLYRIGFLLIIFVLIQAIANDVLRL